VTKRLGQMLVVVVGFLVGLVVFGVGLIWAVGWMMDFW
jgi:hypothetical protein